MYHWIAGLLLTVSILFHIIHSTFFLDFWSIWPDKIDIRDAMGRTLKFFGKPAPRSARASPSIRWKTSSIISPC